MDFSFLAILIAPYLKFFIKKQEKIRGEHKKPTYSVFYHSFFRL